MTPTSHAHLCLLDLKYHEECTTLAFLQRSFLDLTHPDQTKQTDLRVTSPAHIHTWSIDDRGGYCAVHGRSWRFQHAGSRRCVRIKGTRKSARTSLRRLPHFALRESSSHGQLLYNNSAPKYLVASEPHKLRNTLCATKDQKSP